MGREYRGTSLPPRAIVAKGNHQQHIIPWLLNGWGLCRAPYLPKRDARSAVIARPSRVGVWGLYTELPRGHESERLALLPRDPAVPSCHPTVSTGRTLPSFQALPTRFLLQAAHSDCLLSLSSPWDTEQVLRTCEPSEHWQGPCSESQGYLVRAAACLP